MKSLTKLFLTLLILLKPVNSLFSQEQDLNVDFSLLAGLLLPGELYISTGSVETYPETAMSPFFILAVDLSQSRALSFGAYYQLTNMGYYALDDTDVYHTIGLCISPLFYTNTITIKPNIKLGYRSIPGGSSSAGPVQGFATDFGIQFQKRAEGLQPIFEIGFIAQPSGGNDDVYFEFSPIFYFAAGFKT
jgi:hypothetical protein